MDMSDHDQLAQALKTRLAELTGGVAEIDSALRMPLSADSEEQAMDLENQDALEGLEKSKLVEIRQIELALKRIEAGSYGICSQCGERIAPNRLRALPTATKCIACAS
jgi:RNA polymerase-binding transcription factor DksA